MKANDGRTRSESGFDPTMKGSGRNRNLEAANTVFSSGLKESPDDKSIWLDCSEAPIPSAAGTGHGLTTVLEAVLAVCRYCSGAGPLRLPSFKARAT